MIISSEHDNSYLDVDPNGKGVFGLVKTNSIPVYGIDNITAYIDKLGYEDTSKSGTTTYNHVDYLLTSDSDESSIGSKKT